MSNLGFSVVARNAKWSNRPVSTPVVPDFDDKLYALYMPGLKQPNGKGADYSGNCRYADESGATILDDRLVGGTGKVIRLPFNALDLMGGVGTCTIIAVGNCPEGFRAAYVSNSSTTDLRFMSLGVTQTSNLLVYTNDVSLPDSALTQMTPIDTGRYTRFEMVAAVFTPTKTTIFRRHPTDGWLSKVDTGNRVLGGSNKFVLGSTGSGSTAFPGPSNVAAAGFFRGVLTQADLEVVYGAVKPRLFSATGLVI